MSGRKWNPAKYAARTPLSTIVDREIRLIRAPMGSTDWKQGQMHVVDAKTGEVLALVSGSSFFDPKTKWALRGDC